MLRLCRRAAILFAISLSCLAQIPESLAPHVLVKIQATSDMGGMFYMFSWLDNENLVVTSNFPQGGPQSRLFVVNVISGKQQLIAERAVLLCASASENIVGVMRTAEAGAKSSVAFYRWDGTKGEAIEHSPGGHINYRTCSEVASASEGQFESASRNILRWGDGEILLAPPDTGDEFKETMGLLLKKADGKIVPLAATKQDLKGLYLEYVMHRQAYLLSPAQIPSRGSYTVVRGNKVFEKPMVMMSKEGVIARKKVPSTLMANLKHEAIGFPVAPGELYVVQGYGGDGSGLYLARGEQVMKIWCTTDQFEAVLPLSRQSCNPGPRIRVSPNGCSVAFFGDSPRSMSAQLKVINVCSKTAN